MNGQNKYERNLKKRFSIKHNLLVVRWRCFWSISGWCCCCWCSANRSFQLDFINILILLKSGVGEGDKIRGIELSLVEASWRRAGDGFAAVSGGVVEEWRRRRCVKTMKEGAMSRLVRRRRRAKVRGMINPNMGGVWVCDDLRDAVQVAATRRSLKLQFIVGNAGRIPASWSIIAFLFKREEIKVEGINGVVLMVYEVDWLRWSLNMKWIWMNE